MYIVFEGLVGSGKTTQAKKFVEYLREKYPDRDVVHTREPGGTEVAEEIRRVVQHDIFDEEMHPVTEAYLYAASRAESLRKVVKPALESGDFVVSDRNFFTTIAHQGFGRELGYEKAYEICKVAVESIVPDLIVYIDLPVEKSLSRLSDQKEDKFEKLGLDFHSRVKEGYEFIAEHPKYEPSLVRVSALGSIEEVFENLISVVKPRLP